jgi:hypothetical protein
LRDVFAGGREVHGLWKGSDKMKYTLGCFLMGCAIFMFSLFGEGIPFAARIMGMTLALGIWMAAITIVAFWEIDREMATEVSS